MGCTLTLTLKQQIAAIHTLIDLPSSTIHERTLLIAMTLPLHSYEHWMAWVLRIAVRAYEVVVVLYLCLADIHTSAMEPAVAARTT